nr:MAG TPA: hypothetical protein [Caudoviricetes sp.]
MSNKNGFRVVERRGVVRTLRLFYMPGAVLTLFKWGEKGFYTFYTFYNVNNEIFIYSTYILQTFYKMPFLLKPSTNYFIFYIISTIVEAL